MAEARGALEEVRKAIEDFNAIPFIEFDLPGDEMLAGLIDAADSIDRQIGQVQTLAEQASTFARDASYLMDGDLGETRQNLENFLAVVAEYDGKVAVWREQVAVLKASLPGWIDTATVVSSLFLFWFAFSQAGMFLHGLTLWKNGDPLAALRTPVS